MPVARVSSDLHRSARAFDALVWPVIRSYCGGGELARVESADGHQPLALRMLDELAGIDYVLANPDDTVWGIASRVQFVRDRSYDTFTIREARTSGARTELGKRMKTFSQIEHAPLTPGWTVQAYATDDDEPSLLSVGVIRTSWLIGYIRWGKEGHDWSRRATTNASFVYVPWARLPSHMAPFVWRAQS